VNRSAAFAAHAAARDADGAEHVLPHFEEEYSVDDRPRRAIEAGRAWARGEISVSEARAAAFAALTAATDVVSLGQAVS